MSRRHTEVQLSSQTNLSQELDREMRRQRRDTLRVLKELGSTAAQAKASVRRFFSRPSVRDGIVAEIKYDMALDLSELESASGLSLESERREIGFALRLYIRQRDAPKTKDVLRSRRKITEAANALVAALDAQQSEGRYIADGFVEEGIEIPNLLSTLQKIETLARREADDLAQKVKSKRGAPWNMALYLLIGSAVRIYRRAGGRGVGSYYKPETGMYDGPLFRLIIEMLRMAGDVSGGRFHSSTVGQQAKSYVKDHGGRLGRLGRRMNPNAKAARKTIPGPSKIPPQTIH